MKGLYKNMGFIMILLIPLTFFAFYESYFEFLPRFPNQVSKIVHIHTASALIWLLILILQPVFIGAGKVRIHRIIGKSSYYVFPLFVITSCILTVRMFESKAGFFAIIPAGETFILSICYGLAIYYKRQTALHMRYMLGTAIVLLGPIFARILPYFLETWSALQRENLKLFIIEVIILVLLYSDRKLKKQNTYSYVFLLFLTHHILMNWILH